MFAKIEISGMMEVVTGMHIGGSSAFSAIGHGFTGYHGYQNQSTYGSGKQSKRKNAFSVGKAV